jgi:hypothetical protein
MSAWYGNPFLGLEAVLLALEAVFALSDVKVRYSLSNYVSTRSADSSDRLLIATTTSA